MLSAELVQTVRRKGSLRPRFVDPDDPGHLDRATELVALFEQHVGHRRAQLDEAIDDLLGDDSSQKLTRGLAKLLDDRCAWIVDAPADPELLRRRVFELASGHHPVSTVPRPTHGASRDEILTAVADELGLTPEAVDEGLYADLPERQVLHAWEPITPRDLLDRYNLSSAQALLLRATELRATVSPARAVDLRALVRALRFHQLMFRTLRGDGGSWHITIDGPVSVLKASQRYGIQFANALAAIATMREWSIEAEIREPGKPSATFTASHRDPIRAPRRLAGAWVPDEVTAFKAQLESRQQAWVIEPEPDLVIVEGQDVVVPDFTLVEVASGRRAHVEVVGFWRRSYLDRRVVPLLQRGPANLIFCVSRRLATELDEAGELDRVVWYPATLPLKAILQLADRVAL
jgi:predicted nuclease of restriction endonuclease-like RecB superfamily